MKTKLVLLAIICLVLLFLGGCAVNTTTLQSTYPKMYSNPPIAIMILPPVNKTTAADAKEYMACSLSEAVGLKGYYVLPVEAGFTVLRDEGLYDAENVNASVLGNIKKYFGADVVLFTTIEQWDKAWFLVSGTLKIKAKFALVSTATADTLWDFTTKTTVNLGSSNSNLIAAAVESAIKTSMEDYFPNARKANILTFAKAMPYGKHHPLYSTDGGQMIPSDKIGMYSISK